MNKDEDCDIYNTRLLYEDNLSHKARILQTRILKFSLFGSESMYGKIGRDLFESGQFQKCIPWLKRALILRSYAPSVRVTLAKALLKLEKENEAFTFIKKELSKGRGLHEFLIEALKEKHKLQDLESISTEIIDMIADPEDIAFYYFEIAEALVRCKKYPQAFVNFQKAFVCNSPMGQHHHETYGFALYHEGMFEEALIQFEHIRRLRPTDRYAFNNMAHLTYCVGKVKEALEGFEYIIENDLQTTSTYANFILVLHHLDQDEGVISTYRDLLQPSINSDWNQLKRRYNEELRVTQVRLDRDDADEKMKEFNAKKLQGINLLLTYFE